MIKVDTYLFYKIGVWAFGIVAVMNTMSYVVTFNTIPLVFNKISGFASLIFNYALFAFFLYLYRSLPPKNQVEMSENEFEELLKKK